MDTCICVAGKKIRIHFISAHLKYVCRDYLCEDGREADDEIAMPQEELDWHTEQLVMHERLSNILLKHDILLIHGATVASEAQAERISRRRKQNRCQNGRSRPCKQFLTF